MQEFTDEYGAYMEMIYVLTGGDLLRKGECFNMEAYSFLFDVQYLLRKRKIENDEQQRRINSKRGGA